ncbi:hypothetical protein GE061_013197, partial [Apolygus lucorum]
MNCLLTFALLLWPVFCNGFEVGYTASMVNFPFVAALYYKEGVFTDNRPFCTGTIITDQYILTTAGCMWRPNPEISKIKMYENIRDVSAWVGSSFGYVKGSRLIDAQMLKMDNSYFPLKEDLQKIWGSDSPATNNYDISGFTYFYLDFCLLKTSSRINFNSYVHAIPFDVQNLTAAMRFWNDTIGGEDFYGTVVSDCYVAGWGGFKGERANKLYRLRYVKARYTERIHCVIAYCGNCSLCHQRFFNESTYTCFSSYMTGDTCMEDEGAPLFCPWFGYKNQKGLGWGAMLALLSGKMGACMKTELPSMYNVIWMAYPFFTRVMKFIWPPPGHEWIVASILFVPSQLVTLCALGVRSALVVDVGYNEAQVIPVYEGVPILNAWEAQPLAGHAIEKRIRENLDKVYKDLTNAGGDTVPQVDESALVDLPESVIEDIKVRGCFVTTRKRGERLSEGVLTPEPPLLEYRLGGDRMIKVPGWVRESSCEVMFEKDNEEASLPNLILDSILKVKSTF